MARRSPSTRTTHPRAKPTTAASSSRKSSGYVGLVSHVLAQHRYRAFDHRLDDELPLQAQRAQFALSDRVERALRRIQIQDVLLAMARRNVSLCAKLGNPVELTLPLPAVESADDRVGENQLTQRGEQAAPLRMHVNEHDDQLSGDFSIRTPARHDRRD